MFAFLFSLKIFFSSLHRSFLMYMTDIIVLKIFIHSMRHTEQVKEEKEEKKR